MTLGGTEAPSRRPHAAGLAFLGAGWLAIAVAFAYAAVGTPLFERLVFSGNMEAAGPLARAAAACLTAVIPTGWAIAGATRLAAAATVASRREVSALRRAAARLEPPVHVLGPVSLPTGRLVPELAICPQGVVVVRELARGAYRNLAGHWEASTEIGWQPCESPLEAAIRDAEAVRRFLGASELDFVVRVHTVVVATDELDRIGGCAVVHPDMLDAFLAATPPQRSMTPERIEMVAALLRR